MRDDDRNRGDGEHVGERLDAFRTGELDAEARARVAAHLESCGRCREELAALASWTAAVERGYEEGRAATAGREPDWAAQRSAIVARTSGSRAAGSNRTLARWAPQIAMLAVAALIVGIVWRENPIEPEDLRRAPSERAEVDAGQRRDAGAGTDREQAGAPAPLAPREEPARETRAAAETAAPPEPAAPGQIRARAGPPELGKQAAPEADEARLENLDALADRAAEPAQAASAADIERFTRAAREALGARDTGAARRALALWSDTLGAVGYVAGEPAILADSLQALLEPAE